MSIARPGTYAIDNAAPLITMILSSLLAASTASGDQASRSYQESVYMEVINHATDSTNAVRSPMVRGSRRRSASLASPGAAVHGTTRDSIHARMIKPM
jgi:hypothetical protein